MGKTTMSHHNLDHQNFSQLFSQMLSPEKIAEAQKHFQAQFPQFEQAFRGCPIVNKPEKEKKLENSVAIPLKKFKPEQVNMNMNKKGLITVTASNEECKDTKRNGCRKMTWMVEETVQLPGYVVDKDMLSSVEAKFVDGFLNVSWPANPDHIVKDDIKMSDGPVEIPITME